MSRARPEDGGERGRIPLRLGEIEAAVARGELNTPAGVSRAAERLSVPEAELRGTASFYADLAHGSARLRICRGTSCLLADEDPASEVAPSGSREVYCLGYCDRSPAVLVGEDHVVIGDAARSLRRGDAAEGVTPSLPAADPIPTMWCTAREPLVLRRASRGDFSDLAAAREDGAYAALAQAIERGDPAPVLDEVERSRHRGRGGAGFPTGSKWRRCAATADPERYVVANGDEGDPGSFIDRVLMELDPHGVLEGLILNAYAVGASRGYVFVRSEYPRATAVMERAIRDARAAGILGTSVMGSPFAFDVQVAHGLGSYVCGEETALLNAIEGRRGEVRIRPPYPTERGLWGHPTVVNNVETLVNVPLIIARGGDAYAALGTASSSGTKAICLNHGFARSGIVEVEFGVSLRSVIEQAGEGARGRLEAVLLGGPMGSVLVPDEWDVEICYGAMQARDIQLGHGGLVAVPEGTDAHRLLAHWLDFMRDESCGRCVPCARGSVRARALVERPGPSERAALARLLDVMEAGSLCAFGQSMPGPMRQLVEHFGPRIFGNPSATPSLEAT